MNKLTTLPPNRKKVIMSTYDLLIEKGMIIGRQEGRHEGQKEGARKKTIEVVCAAFRSGISPVIIAGIVNLTTEDVLKILGENQLPN